MTMQHAGPSVRVRSADGTAIAVFVSGVGRPLVAVHGTTSDHHTWRFALPFLEPHLAVHAIDRRGRGASGDRDPYSLQAEAADVVAVVGAAAAAYGAPVDVIGHSYGGNVAFEAATDTANIRRLVLYEGWPPPNPADRSFAPEVLQELETLLARGQRDRMLELFFREQVKMTDEEIAEIEAAPTWPARLNAAGTVPRELRAFADCAFDPAAAARITVPVLLLVGSESPAEIRADPEVVAAALPDARMGVLDGQAHVAQLTAPEKFADAVRAFLSE
ncbi:MAG TPA: alpha/beta hydrolase [Aldersonia sp.]